jgi:hypothetical protein
MADRSSEAAKLSEDLLGWWARLNHEMSTPRLLHLLFLK